MAITVDRTADDLRGIAAALDADAIQLNGKEPVSIVAALGRPAWKVLHLPPDNTAANLDLAAAHVATARAFLDAGAARILLDTSGGPHPGGTGKRADPALVDAIAREVPVVLAGGLDPASVGRRAQERRRDRRRCRVGRRSARGSRAVDRPRTRSRSHCSSSALGPHEPIAPTSPVDRPRSTDRSSKPTSEAGGGSIEDFGGRYVPETLMAALQQLESAYAALRHDPRFWAELRELLGSFAGRPTPLYRADRLGERVLERARTALDRRCDAVDVAPLPEARGPRPHRRAQDQQRARPGAADAPPREDAGHRRDGRGSARRGHGDGVRAARAAVRRVHGRGGHRAPAAERAPDARAGRRGAARHVGLRDAQGRDQ